MRPGHETNMPIYDLRLIRGEWWHKCSDHQDWMDMGVIPIPRTRWRVFLYHFCHGILMQYPLFDVIRFSMQNSDPANWHDWNGKVIERLAFVAIRRAQGKHIHTHIPVIDVNCSAVNA